MKNLNKYFTKNKYPSDESFHCQGIEGIFDHDAMLYDLIKKSKDFNRDFRIDNKGRELYTNVNSFYCSDFSKKELTKKKEGYDKMVELLKNKK